MRAAARDLTQNAADLDERRLAGIIVAELPIRILAPGANSADVLPQLLERVLHLGEQYLRLLPRLRFLLALPRELLELLLDGIPVILLVDNRANVRGCVSSERERSASGRLGAAVAVLGSRAAAEEAEEPLVVRHELVIERL